MPFKSILITDDEAFVALTLSEALEKLSPEYVITTAADSMAALEQITAHPPDLLITDYKMPGMDGLSLAQVVKQRFPATHVILMTAYGDSTVRATVEDLGLEGYLSKPFKVNELRAMVACALGGACAARRILVVEDTDDLRRLYTRALQRAGYEVVGAATVTAARELLTQQHFAAILCDVHLGRERGTDLLREQLDMLRQQDTQVIMVSADPHYRAVTEELGIEFYMEKPVDVVHLVHLVDRLISAGG